MKWYFALGLVFIVCGTVMSTAAVPLSEPVDELAPAEDTGVALAPADTPNGDRYASFDSNGELVISVDVFSSTETVFDDVFVVGFAGVNGSDEAATIRIKHQSEWLGIYRNTDAGTRKSVDEASNTLRLDPGEQATLGFAVTTDADSPASLSETLTYTMEIPDSESSTGGSGAGGSGGGSVGGGGSGDSGSNTETGGAGGGDTNASDGDGTDNGSTDSPETVTATGETTETPTDEGGGGSGTGVETSTDDPTDTPTINEEETQTVAGGGAEPVPSTPESQQSAEPSEFALGFDPAFGISWGLWAFIAGLLAVVTNYLVQTRYHDVLPVLQTQPSDRRHRFRRVAVREAAVGLAGIVLTVLVVSAASSAGFDPVAQLATALAFSAAVGTVTGYRLLPELDTMLEPQAANGGTEEQ
ncbi:ATP synthase subunit I [Haloarcula sp. NS06]|uniref:ATP synthase subunit I n=1 Tax=unclassified Haloarcula TaxID=2624677 RepID=UPI0027B2B818|nr:ATP synthase subunit I [Haloarcula sp. H-GB4]MDQ2070912.1 ATP synthase subunit I [Haloarcula sp. H-GB4]